MLKVDSILYATARRIKAARALLDWSQEDLANAARLSITTIYKLEAGHISPRGATMLGVRKAFEDNGLEFIEPNGVRYHADDLIAHQDTEGILAFFDDINQTRAVFSVKVIKICT